MRRGPTVPAAEGRRDRRATRVARPYTCPSPALCRNRPPFRIPRFPPPCHRSHVAVSHLLNCIPRQRRPESASAVQDQLRRTIGNHRFDIALDDPFPHVRRRGRVAGLPLAVFAYIDQHGLRIGGEPRARLGDGQLLHPPLGFVDECDVRGRMMRCHVVLLEGSGLRTINRGARSRRAPLRRA